MKKLFVVLAAIFLSVIIACSGGGGGDSISGGGDSSSGTPTVGEEGALKAGATTNLATVNLNTVGGRKLLAIPTIGPLTFGPAPAGYGGHNHSLHVNILWKVLVNGVEKTHFSQRDAQNIIQLQGFDDSTTAGLKAITLQAVNSSYWSLDDAPYGTTPVGTNNFYVLLSAMEFDGIADGGEVRDASLGAGATTNLATVNLNTVGGRKLLAIPTIGPLTFGPAPAGYGGQNHSLHVNILWKVLVDGVEKTHFSQRDEQDIIQLQGLDASTTAGLKAITLQAVNSSYWSLDDAPYGTTPVGTNNFYVLLSAMEFDGIADGGEVRDASLGAGATTNLATVNLNTVGGRKLLAIPTIGPLTFGPAPAGYGGQNHSLHVNILWKVLVDGVEKTHFSQRDEQDIIQLQGLDASTTAGSKTITLQAVNSSYWSLDDAPYGTTPVGTNNFDVLLSAMEL